MAMITMCDYPPPHHVLPHRKYVLRFCANLPGINLPIQESDKNHSNTHPMIRFHVYHLIARCSVHVIHPLYERVV